MRFKTIGIVQIKLKCFIVISILLTYKHVFGLPNCPGSPRAISDYNQTRDWNNCEGTLILDTSKTNCMNCTVTGRFINGKPHGKIIEKYPTGIPHFYGDVKNGARDGYGIIVLHKGHKYEGEFKNHERHGYGYYIRGAEAAQNIGDKYIGNFKNNQPHGRGTYYFVDGRVYDGTWNGFESFEGEQYDKNEFKNYDIRFYDKIEIRTEMFGECVLKLSQ